MFVALEGKIEAVNCFVLPFVMFVVVKLMVMPVTKTGLEVKLTSFPYAVPTLFVAYART